MGDKAMFDSILRNNNKVIFQTDKEVSKQTKQTIISLSYTDSLTSHDLYELSDVLSTIAQYKSSNKKKGL